MSEARVLDALGRLSLPATWREAALEQAHKLIAAVPAWWPNAVVLLLIALAFALGSERLLHKFYRGMVETWYERHAAAT